MSVTVYGIANCDMVKKARAWLDAKGVAYTFHDYKKLPPDGSEIARWLTQITWEKLLNRAGTTFRKLPEADKANIDEAKAINLMIAQPSMIKRPVVELPGGLLVGFAPDTWDAALG